MIRLLVFFFLLVAPFCTRGQVWSDLGGGTNGETYCISKWNNKIFAGGDFTLASGNYMGGTALWNGATWDSMAAGGYGWKICAEVYNNEIYVGGGFAINGVFPPIRNIGRWTGTQWSPLGNGIFTWDFIRKLAVFNNELYVGGHTMILTLDSVGIPRDLTKWNGLTWDTLSGFNPTGINDLDVFQNELYVTSANTPMQCSNGLIYKFNGTQSTVFCDSLLDFFPHQSAVHQNMLYVAGIRQDTLTGFRFVRIVKFDGLTWYDVGTWSSFNVTFFDMVSFNGDLYLGGDFSLIDGITYFNLAKLSSTILTPANGASNNGSPNQSYVHCLFADSVDNKLYMSGLFNWAGNTPALNIAVWDLSSSTLNMKEEKQITISPNPASDQILILNNEIKIGKIEMSDLTGRTVLKTNATFTNNQTQLNISHLQRGVDTLTVSDVKNDGLDVKNLKVVKW